MSKIPELSKEKREIMEEISTLLNAFGVPHGDMAIPADTESSRYVISRWQRGAMGATVAIVAYDNDGNLCVAMGPQRNELNLPAGYSELPLPKVNFTDIPKESSRTHAKDKDVFIKADGDLYETARREVEEELDIDLGEIALFPLDVWSAEKDNPIVRTANVAFAAILPRTIEHYPLSVVDEEFKADDLDKPQWFKVSEISKGEDDRHFAAGNKLPIRAINVEMLEKAVTAARNAEITRISDGVFTTAESVTKRFSQKIASVCGKDAVPSALEAKGISPAPGTNLGAEARSFHAAICDVAHKLTARAEMRKNERQKSPLTSENIATTMGL